jgi:lipopolysaccharide transport system ATP-binding protein
VGDLVFQRKCLGKMTDVAHDGRTVLLVSHNMSAVHAMSDLVMLFDDGRLCRQGPPHEVIAAFVDRLESADREPAASDLRSVPRPPAAEAAFVEGFLNRRPLHARHTVRSGEDLAFELVVRVTSPRRRCYVGLNVEDEFGVRVWSVHSRWQIPRFDLPAGEYRITCVVARPPLVPGHYHVSLELVAGQERLDTLDRLASIHVLEGEAFRTSEVPGREHGYVHAPAEWAVADIAAGVDVPVRR